MIMRIELMKCFEHEKFVVDFVVKHEKSFFCQISSRQIVISHFELLYKKIFTHLLFFFFHIMNAKIQEKMIMRIELEKFLEHDVVDVALIVVNFEKIHFC